MVADSTESYIDKAVSLGKNKKQLEKIRKNLRQWMQDSPLCDSASFAKNIEADYHKLWASNTANITNESSKKYPQTRPPELP
jgi:protein O-GlcNAc transferase